MHNSNWAEHEMEGAVVPHRRAIPNLISICNNVAENAGMSFSAAAGHGGRQAATRLMVEYYTRRWMIERLHYTLKSGLRIERLQFDHVHSLTNALATYWIMAWHILYLTHVAREQPEDSARYHLQPEDLTVLEQTEGKAITTVAQVVQAIAKLAGYRRTPKGGPPGVKSLWLGMRKLEAMVEGWKLAIAYMNIAKLE